MPYNTRYFRIQQDTFQFSDTDLHKCQIYFAPSKVENTSEIQRNSRVHKVTDHKIFAFETLLNFTNLNRANVGGYFPLRTIHLIDSFKNTYKVSPNYCSQRTSWEHPILALLMYKKMCGAQERSPQKPPQTERIGVFMQSS